MKSITLEKHEQLDEIKNSSDYAVIFKHNTSCPISKMAKINFEKGADALPENTNVYFLDLLSYRDLSNAIAEEFNTEHESPQILLIKNGECSFHQSLYDISVKDLAEAMGGVN